MNDKEAIKKLNEVYDYILENYNEVATMSMAAIGMDEALTILHGNSEDLKETYDF